jgi:hypothetical protein
VPAISGKGAYNIKELSAKMDGLMKRIPKGTFSSIGSRWGPLGGLAGHAISKISGYGSYKVGRNTLGTDTIIGHQAQNIPTFSPSEHGSRVRHREFISNVVVPLDGALFNNDSKRLAVDNAELFPWLSRLAQQYQKYKVHGMVFYYRSTSTDYNNSGTVAVSVNYNATEFKYSSIEQVLNSMFAVASKPSDSFAAPVECDPEGMPDGGYYVRHESAVKTTTDLRMSSVGTVQFVTEGLTLPAGTVVGQLWCTYDVELLFPYITPENAIKTTTWYAQSYFRNSSNTLNEFVFESSKFPFDFTSVGTGHASNLTILLSERTEPGNYQVTVTVKWLTQPENLGSYFGIDLQIGTNPGLFVVSQNGDMILISGTSSDGAMIKSAPTHPDHYDLNVRTLEFEVPEGFSGGSLTGLIPKSSSRIAAALPETIMGNVDIVLRKL